MTINATPTLTYYNQNAPQFAQITTSVDFAAMQQRFTDKLPVGGLILDFGCGAGRDTKAFLSKGFQVEAVDGSEELCKIAGEYTGIPVRQMFFQELKEIEKYDGIWACASILHVKKRELPEVLQKMSRALKAQGVIYTSFKYGTFEGERNGRYFTDMTEEAFRILIENMDDIQIEEQWITTDVRPGREEEKWLNLILRKK
ncbi:MAG: class I SAM-dependent methyltransferase [Bacteroidales bacterium]|nr:class I SAM-dependent methyltransferase [Lachnoclostridium sp.]MCM1383874.1 class I SAM-dependent methyltransferase [Lachnoclostridium sp.]MCM1464473.1 class I SAM-dependent methyltransferase [Bacteroidales bacterium]